jgi:hypothetical protein
MFCLFLVFAADLAFPAEAGVVDVTRAPYSAKGDGKADDTAAIQKALNDHMQGGILYFPPGTYRITSTLRWAKKDSKGRECWGNITLQGAGTGKTILRLADGTFTDPAKPQTVMWCGGFGSADWFHNYIHDLTIDTGRDNPGAIGLQFYSNNSGGVRDVRIVSGDGQGITGLDLAHRGMNGPLLVKHVHIKGFQTGLLAGHGVNSQTLEYLTLEDQTDSGLVNSGQALSIRKLTTRNVPLAVRHKSGHLVLLDSDLGGKGSTAIDNAGSLFARNVRARGFDRALTTTRGTAPEGLTLAEFVSEPVRTLFEGTPEKSLGLTIKDTPPVTRQEPAHWVNVRTFHKGGDDWSPAIQAAIDSGAETIYFPIGAYKIGKTIEIRGKVRHVIGLNGWFAESAGKFADSVPRFRVGPEGAAQVVFDNFRGGFGGRIFIEYSGKRTLVLRECSGVPLVLKGEGEVYLEDVCGCPWGGFVLRGPQKVWARQFNVEMFVKKDLPATVDVAESTLWVLGLKTEQGNRLVASRNGAKVEILGGLIYTVSPHEGRPAFLNEESSLVLSLMEQCFIGKPMDPAIRETREGITREIKRASLIGLYAGHKSR